MGMTVFERTGRDMKDEYPELGEIEEFADLRNREIKLCWYIANRTSSIAKLNKKDRIEKALRFCYGDAIDRPDLQKIKLGKFPDKIIAGMKRMATFNPSIRLRAKYYIEYAFDKLSELIAITEKTMVSMDSDERKKYADLLFKMASEMPEMVKLQERGFGIKVRDPKKKKTVVSASISEVTEEL